MPECELCGKELGKLIRAEIEGSELKVCPGCGKFGRVLGEVRTKEEAQQIAEQLLLKKKPVIPEEEIEERVVSDFGERLRKAREKKRMKQEEFAQLLNEKESQVQKWERGELKPGLEIARKLEKLLGISLVGKVEEGKVELGKVKGGEVTLGDVVTVRKKK